MVFVGREGVRAEWDAGDRKLDVEDCVVVKGKPWGADVGQN